MKILPKNGKKKELKIVESSFLFPSFFEKAGSFKKWEKSLNQAFFYSKAICKGMLTFKKTSFKTCKTGSRIHSQAQELLSLFNEMDQLKG